MLVACRVGRLARVGQEADRVDDAGQAQVLSLRELQPAKVTTLLLPAAPFSKVVSGVRPRRVRRNEADARKSEFGTA